jgi:glucans biosynthesis protein C
MNPTKGAAISPGRRPEFDQLRVFALGAMIAFHSAIGFSSWPWLVNDPHHSATLDLAVDFVWRWRVELVFVVSGAALMLALRKRTPSQIVVERIKRLLIPLVFAVLIVVPPQVYLERVQRGQFRGSYLDYLPHFADGIYPQGNLSWHHMWFVPYVLVLTMLALPLFQSLRLCSPGRSFQFWIRWAADHHLYWLLVVPLALAQATLFYQEGDNHSFLGDPHGWLEFALLFILGGAFAEWPELQSAVERGRLIALVVGLSAYAVMKAAWPAVGDNPSILPATQAIGWCAISAVSTYALILAVVGYLTAWRKRPSAGLAYATEAALPVYILHQTFIVMCVFEFAHLPHWPLIVKIVLTVALSLIASLALFEFVIRRSRWLRPLFGMRAIPAPRAIGKAYASGE